MILDLKKIKEIFGESFLCPNYLLNIDKKKIRIRFSDDLKRLDDEFN